jgi:hypothetical protein
VSSEFDILLEWNGGDHPDDLKIYFNEELDELNNNKYPNIKSHFGHGIVTINPPYFFRTPPGVNLMTINPPNYIIPNITPMTGIIETDNLRQNFTFNLKMQVPNILVHIPAGKPLAAFIPIPRYYADEFELKNAENLFDKELIDEELKASNDAGDYRDNVEPTLKNGVGKHYMQGIDVYGNVYKNHQKP